MHYAAEQAERVRTKTAIDTARKTRFGPWVRDGYELLIVTPTGFKIRSRGSLGRTFELREDMTTDDRQSRVNMECDEIDMDIAING